jgi:hypothetical protein
MGELSYRYLWCVVNGDNNCFAAIGDGGNIIYVNPKRKIIVIITSRFKPHAKNRIELIKKHFISILENSKI